MSCSGCLYEHGDNRIECKQCYQLSEDTRRTYVGYKSSSETIATQESSPHGIPLGAPGCKLSAGKPKLSFAIDGFPTALKAVAAVGQFGHEEKGYGLDSWKTVPDGEKEYREARYRHQADIAKGEYLDSQSRYPHLFHVAWNALAELELHIQNNPDCFKRDK